MGAGKADDMAAKRVSVIVPVYNVEKYLGECLDSLMAQTCREIEIVCVNDGSTDRSMEILERYAKKDERIKVISQENGGLSAARNTGLRHAQGKYVCFIDSDDLLVPEAVAEMLEKAEDGGLDVLQFNWSLLFEDKALESEFADWKRTCHRKREYPEVMSGPELFARMHEADDLRPNAVMQFFRREFLEENGLGFYDGILHEDELFTFRVMMTAKRAAHTPRAYYVRRVRGDSIMTAPLTYNNFKGYFIGFVEMFKMASAMTFEPAVEKAVWEHIAGRRNWAFHVYMRLPKSEQRGVDWTDDAFSQGLFRMNDMEEIKKLLKSRSYRIGHLVTAPGRALRRNAGRRKK